MKIKDKEIGEMVNVSCVECPKYECYWPRPDPGIFTQGQGYRRKHDDGHKDEWLCGNREIRGCPEIPKQREVM